MKSHYLADFHFAGKEIALANFPNFDFYNLGKVTSMRIDFSDCDLYPNVSVCSHYTEPNGSATTEILFLNVSSLRLPESLPIIYLSEIEIEDISKWQNEEVRYFVKSYGPDRFEIKCLNIEVVTCDPMSS